MGGASRGARGGEGVHELSFGLKRAHLRAVAVHLPLARRFGLTPARFDVMFAIWEESGCALQIGIAHRLGLSPTTICKMLKVMEDAGLVERAVHQGDLRQRWVMFTRRGFKRFSEAMEAFLRNDHLRAFYDGIHEEGRAFVARVASAARFVAKSLGDWSSQWYPDTTPDKWTRVREDERSEHILGEIRRNEAAQRAVIFQRPRFLAAAAAVGAARNAEEIAAATDRAMIAAVAAAAAHALAPPTAAEVDSFIQTSSSYWDAVNARRDEERMAAAALAEEAPDAAIETPRPNDLDSTPRGSWDPS